MRTFGYVHALAWMGSFEMVQLVLELVDKDKIKQQWNIHVSDFVYEVGNGIVL